MSSKERKLGAIGLTVRDELSVKSLLQVISSQTTEHWTFHDGIDVDVVLCSPSSPLADVATKRAQRSAATRCVSVVHGSETALPGTMALHAPLKSCDFIALLNACSKPGARADMPSRRSQTLASILHQSLGQASRRLYRIGNAHASVLVEPSGQKFYCHAAQSEAEIVRLLDSAEVRIEPQDEESARHFLAHAGTARALDRLLWQVGLLASHGEALNPLADTAFALRRWPDFGRFEHRPFHFHLSAFLVRRAYFLDELAQATGHTPEDTTAFVNACALCGLLEIQKNVVRASKPVKPPTATRYTGIFRSIRLALGM